MTLTELMQAIDQLPTDELIQLYQYIEDKRDQFIEEKIRMLDEGFAGLWNSLTDEELKIEIFWKLGYILSEIDKLGNDTAKYFGLFVPEANLLHNEPITVSTPCAVLPVPYEGDIDFRPDFAIKNNLYEISSAHLAVEIVQNARHQKPDCTLEELVDALIYYRMFDIFITFAGSTEPLYEPLEHILSNLDRYEEKEGGNYYLFAPQGFQGKHLAETFCMMRFVEDQEFEKNSGYLPADVIESKLYKVADISVLKNLLGHALSHKPNPLDVVTVLNHYILTGSFFESEGE